MEIETLFNDMLSHNQVLKSLYTNARLHGILVTDVDGHIIHMNETFSTLYGYKPEEVQGMHSRIFFTREDRDKMMPELEIEKVREQGSARDRNYILHSNKTPMWSDGESLLVTDAKGHSFIFKIIQNLQEQKRLEIFLTEMHQFNSSVIDSIQDGILVLNRECKILKANQRFHELFEEAVNVEGCYIQELRHSFFSEHNTLDQLKEMMYSGHLQNFELEYTPADQVTKNILVVSRFVHKDHERTRLLLLFRDVTLQVNAQRQIEAEVVLRTMQLNKANQALQIANASLKRSNINLEQFAYAASHNLKEPARKIHLFANQLKNELSNNVEGQDRLYFERLEANSRHMINQIDKLLSYAQAGIPPSEMEPINLNQLIADTIRMLEPVIQQKQADITTANLPMVMGHAFQLKEVFYNLLANALLYQKSGNQPRIIISASEVPAGALPVAEQAKSNVAYYVIQIKDNGIGFAPQYAEDIFNVFYRLHSQGEFEGSGIGLAVVHRIVQHHDGFIIAESEEGQGATFKLYLPQQL